MSATAAPAPHCLQFGDKHTDFPDKYVLQLGRDHGRPAAAKYKGAGHKEALVKRWHLMQGEDLKEQRERLFGQAMPENATVCQSCFKAERVPNDEFDRSQALQVILGPESNHRWRAQMVQFFGPMPNVVINAFAAWMTLRFWLGMEGEAGDRSRESADIWFLYGSAAGGRVQYNTGMIDIMPGFAQMLISFAGSVKQAVQPLATIDGFWSAAGSAFSAMLDKIISTDRLARIQSGILDAVTPWVDDWFTLPSDLRNFMHEALAGDRERVFSMESIHRPRAEQKFRAMFTTVMMMFYAKNPQCNEPLHSALHRICTFNGRTYDFRVLLGRLGLIIGETLGRENQAEHARMSGPARDQFLRDAILSRKFLMLVDDNLDWDGATSREHQLLSANKHSGVHVLNRQAMSMVRHGAA